MIKSKWTLVLSGILLLGAQTGCVSLLGGKKRSPKLDTTYLEASGYSIPPGGMPSPVGGQMAGDGPAIVMEVRTPGDKPHLERIPLSREKPMFIEDLVREAKIHERLGGTNISIMRPAGPNLPPVRMDVRVSDSGKVKNMEDNYALMPGDHLVVNYDQRTSLESFFDSLHGK